MRNPGQHFGSFHRLTQNPLPHGMKRHPRQPDLSRAFQLEIRDRPPQPQLPCGLGQSPDRADLTTDEHQCNRKEQHRCADGPQYHQP